MNKIFTLLAALCLCAAALPAQSIFSADFEGDNANVTLGGEWVISANNTSQYFPIPDNTVYASVNDDGLGQGVSGNGDLVFTDMIDLTDVAFPILSFSSFFIDGDFNGNDERAEVIVSTDMGATWAIVGEATPAGEWTTSRVLLTDYAGQMIQLGFRYTDGNEWNYGFAIDNVEIFVPNAKDVSVTVQGPDQRFFPITDEPTVAFGATVTNVGYDTITSVDLVLSDGVNEVVETLDGLSLTYGESASVIHDGTVTINEAISYDVSITAMNLNGDSADENMDDNTGSSSINGISAVSARRYFAEEATGTWCPWCPRGHVFMEEMTQQFGDQFVGIAVHGPTLASDPMTIPEYGEANGSMVSGYPSVAINRAGEVDPSEMPDDIDANLNSTTFYAPADPTMNATLDVATKSLTVSSDATMRTALDSDFMRMGFILVEDEVTGTGSGYAQANNYSGFAPLEGAGIDWEAAANPVPASDMVYQDVARMLIGGFNGIEGSIPAGTTDGQLISVSETVDFPENSWDPKHMRAVVTLIDTETGFVHNAQKAEVSIVCPTETTATVTVQDNTDGGTPNGAVSVTDNGLGIAPFSYAWASGETTADLTGLFPGTYELLITDHAGCTQTVSAEVQGTTDVADLDGVRQFTVTPNPARDLTTLRVVFNAPRNVEVALYDLMGRQLQRFQHTSVAQVNQVFDLAALTTGTYLVRVQSDDQVRTERLQVVR